MRENGSATGIRERLAGMLMQGPGDLMLAGRLIPGPADMEKTGIAASEAPAGKPFPDLRAAIPSGQQSVGVICVSHALLMLCKARLCPCGPAIL